MTRTIAAITGADMGEKDITRIFAFLCTVGMVGAITGILGVFHAVDTRSSAKEALSIEQRRYEELYKRAGSLSKTVEMLTGLRDIGSVIDITVVARAYTAREEETDDRPWETGCGTLAVPWTIALSDDMWVDYNIKCGDIVILTGIGPFTVTDFKPGGYRQADLLFPSVETAKIFGVRQAVVTLIGGG